MIRKTAFGSDCPAVFEDDRIIVLEKSSGVLSHPNTTGLSGPRCAFRGPYDFSEERFDTPAGPVWLVHRLDREASGLLVACRGKEMALRMRDLFLKREIEKIYTVLVAGRPPWAGVWKDAIGERKEKEKVRAFIRPGRPPNAELRFKVRRTFHKLYLSLLSVRIITGRTHQIRAQAARHRHPVAGDGVYGDFKLNRFLRKAIGLDRLFLHASGLSFRHPGTGKMLRLESPLPEDLHRGLLRAR